MKTILQEVDTSLPASLKRLFELLRIQSISADSRYSNECEKAAVWLKKYLEEIGFKAQCHLTKGQPIVLAQSFVHKNVPTILFYGHYDVQPVDPITLWTINPFEPCIKETATGEKIIHGRGAADDKGQILTFLEACRVIFNQNRSLPINITVLLEGEEESGGEHLPEFIARYKEQLNCDVSFICDTDMATPTRAAITAMVRGLVSEEIIIHGANRDLHSGLYGNAAQNPIHILTQIISSLRDDQGRITLKNFYEGVPEISDHVRALWQKIGKNDNDLLTPIGLKQPAGEKNYRAIEQTWCRPSFEVNGITGGYQEEGFKTIIPAMASAKISFRLVGKQDPFKIRDSFREFVQAIVPKDCRVEFKSFGAAPATMVSLNNPRIERVKKALDEEWECETAIVGSGSAIPVVGEFQRQLGIESILIGFSNPDDCIHSPNEKYNLRSFHKGIRSWVRILYALQN